MRIFVLKIILFLFVKKPLQYTPCHPYYYSVHVISGKYKGHKLQFKKNKFIRPMTQKVKEAIFDIIGDRIAGALMLDLFCGSGSVGIEALSRGAVHAVFVDLQVREVVYNITELGLSSKVEINKRDVFKAIRKLGKENRTFDTIFIGAPYGFKKTDDVLAAIDDNKLIRSGGILLLEFPSERKPKKEFKTFNLTKTYPYGQTMIGRYEG